MTPQSTVQLAFTARWTSAHLVRLDNRRTQKPTLWLDKRGESNQKETLPKWCKGALWIPGAVRGDVPLRPSGADASASRARLASSVLHPRHGGGGSRQSLEL